MSEGKSRDEENGLISRIRLVLLLMSAIAIIIYLVTPIVTGGSPVPERLLTGVANSLLIGSILGAIVHIYLEKARRNLVKEEFRKIVDQDFRGEIEELRTELTKIIEKSVHEHAKKIDASLEMKPAALIEEIEDASQLYLIGQLDVEDFTMTSRDLPTVLMEKFDDGESCEVLHICDLEEKCIKSDYKQTYEEIFRNCTDEQIFRIIDIDDIQIVNAVIIDEDEVIYFTETSFETYSQKKIIKITSEDIVSSFCSYIDLRVETAENSINSVEELS